MPKQSSYVAGSERPGAAVLELDADKTVVHIRLNRGAAAEWARLLGQAAGSDPGQLRCGSTSAEAVAKQLNKTVVPTSEILFAEVALDDELTFTSDPAGTRRRTKERLALLGCGFLVLLTVVSSLRGVLAFMSDLRMW